MKCQTCGDEHELLDPVFHRPDHVAAFPFERRKGNILETDDICAIRAQPSHPADRFFVRCTLSVPLLDSPSDVRWGMWAEIGQEDAVIVRDRWDDEQQANQPPMPATLANNVPGYPPTMGLRCKLQLTGPETRPMLVLDARQDHPFVAECTAGVSLHRVTEWLVRMGMSRPHRA